MIVSNERKFEKKICCNYNLILDFEYFNGNDRKIVVIKKCFFIKNKFFCFCRLIFGWF